LVAEINRRALRHRAVDCQVGIEIVFVPFSPQERINIDFTESYFVGKKWCVSKSKRSQVINTFDEWDMGSGCWQERAAG
jgi:hypothetical protein